MTGKDDLKRKPRIVLSHASEDKPRVRELYHQLKEAGYHPWLDGEDLLPGQDWWVEIKKVVSETGNLVVVCLSHNSITKRGTVQREIKRALDVLEQMPEDTIYLIPARLEDCQVPDRLSDLQWVDLFEPDGFDKLARALDFEIDKHQTPSQSIASELASAAASESLTGDTIRTSVTGQLAQDRKVPRSRYPLATSTRHRRIWIAVILLMLVVVGSVLVQFSGIWNLQLPIVNISMKPEPSAATKAAQEPELISGQTSQATQSLLLTALKAAGIDRPEVHLEDTDGDGQNEWVVFYQFDTTGAHGPYAGVVYDYSSEKPPVIFADQLLPPERYPLSEGTIRLELRDAITVNEWQPKNELFVYGTERELDTALNIFRHEAIQSGATVPYDDSPRCKVIGSFRGDGGVIFDPNTNHVTVINQEVHNRSQLAVQTVYALDENWGTYMSLTNPEQLSSPISEEVSFARGMPSDILDTPYSEKLVLGFYEMLAAKKPDVAPRDFLTGQALIEFDNNDLSYFGFGGVSGKMTDVDEVRVTQLSIAPQAEQIGSSVTPPGEPANFNFVRVGFQSKVGETDIETASAIVWATTVVDGKWKIDQRLQ